MKNANVINLSVDASTKLNEPAEHDQCPPSGCDTQNRKRNVKQKQSQNNQCVGNVILLNKLFLGGWLDKQGNIGHEIIDFLLTDKGEHYVYNNPLGVCPKDIWIDGTKFPRSKEEKYLGKYMVLTSEKRGKEFDILYVIELAEKLHGFSAPKNKTKLRDIQKKIQQDIIKNRDIKYNGKYLYDIYKNDDSLYLTFKGEKIYKADTPITFEETTHNFQRNKGYIYDDKDPDDYKKLITLIEDSIKNGTLKAFKPRNVSPSQIGQSNANKTFIDLIKQEYNEQIYTNILHSVLEQGDLFKNFCDKFRKGKPFNSTDNFKVFRETKVVDGRMDICAESDSQRVIIENKINSGLNGLRPADNTTQLSTYYTWGTEKKTKPLCFVVAPDHRIDEIKREIHNKDPRMANIYTIIPYSEIADFIEDQYKSSFIPSTYSHYSLMPQIIDAFRNLSLPKEDLYARMFLDATN